MVVPRTSGLGAAIATNVTDEDETLQLPNFGATSDAHCSLNQRPLHDGYQIGNTLTDHTLAHIISSQKQAREQDQTIIIEAITTQLKFEDFKNKLTSKIEDYKPFTINKTTEKTVKIIIPANNKHFNQLSKKLHSHETYTDLTKKPPHIYNPAIDTRPWLCISKAKCNNKQDFSNIQTQLSQANISFIALHLQQTGASESSLMKFKLQNHNQETLYHATQTQIQTTLHTTTPKLFIEKTATRCTNCHKLDHTKQECTQQHHTCVICAGKCPIGQCKNPTKKKCVNCNKNHASTFSNCKALRLQKKSSFKNTIQSITSQASLSASEQHIAQNITDMETNIKKQLAEKEETINQLKQQSSHSHNTSTPSQTNINKKLLA